MCQRRIIAGRDGERATHVLGFDDVDEDEDSLEGEPAGIDQLRLRSARGVLAFLGHSTTHVVFPSEAVMNGRSVLRGKREGRGRLTRSARWGSRICARACHAVSAGQEKGGRGGRGAPTHWLKIRDSETAKLNTVKPFARIAKGRISTEYLRAGA